MGKGSETRERILAIAEASVLAKGFGATSIEELIAEAGLTKSGFFYHFRDKNELAKALLVRYVATNTAVLDDIFSRARQLSEDPLQSFLIGLKLLAETMADLPNGHPGCLVASYVYEERLFDRDVRDLNRSSIRGWNAFFLALLEDIAEVYEPREPVALATLAQMVSCIIDGGIIMGKALQDPAILPRQIEMFRAYVKMLFSPAVAVRAAA